MKNGLSENSDAVQNENSNILETTSPLPLPACGEGFGVGFVENLSIFQNIIMTELEYFLVSPSACGGGLRGWL